METEMAFGSTIMRMLNEGQKEAIKMERRMAFGSAMRSAMKRTDR